LAFTKAGKYTVEEFETAHEQFLKSDKPYIYTFFKDAPFNIGDLDKNDLKGLFEFKERLEGLGHFTSGYTNTEGLKLKFIEQFDKIKDQIVMEKRKTNKGAER
jgi:hypothetical protein